MAIPRVFVSSTCYDLKYIRENLKYFVRTIGYEPVLSDDGDIFYNPSSHTHDACLKEVSTCQIFVLIIGGRYGGAFKESDSSITNNEYREAVKEKIPVFVLVEASVYSDHNLYQTNFKENHEIVEKIRYPSCDNVKIFKFIDEVRRKAVNNALFSFNDFSDIESYLKKQWAGMLYDFLDQKKKDSHFKTTNKLLDDLTLATRKSEELIKVLLKASSKTANDTISRISNEVEAEKFLDDVFDYFELELGAIDFEGAYNLKKLPEKWVDFLLCFDVFNLSDEEEVNEIKITFLVAQPSNMQFMISDVFDEYFSVKYDDFQESYEKLKKLDQEIRQELFERFGE